MSGDSFHPVGPDDPPGADARHSWTPIDLVLAAENPPEPPTIGGLLYPGKRTLISGERDSLKTWLALILAKAEMEAGHAVGWADFDAMGAGDIADRLRLLGVDDDTISRLFLYYAPVERLAGDRLGDVAQELADRNARMFVADAFNPFLNLHGLDPTKTSDVETFWFEVADPICREGVAMVPLDHVVKNAGNRGQYAYGSERKGSGAIVHLGTRIVKPFGRGRVGSSVLDCHRDRQGYLPRPVVGVLALDATGDGITYQLEGDRSRSGDGFRPTVLMERVSRKIEGLDKPVPLSWVEDNVEGKTDTLRHATQTLVNEGFLVEDEGPRSSRLFSSVRPYREDEDLPEHEDVLTSPRPRPDLAPSLRSTPSSTSPLAPPIRGEVEVGETSPLTSPPTSPQGPVTDAEPGGGHRVENAAPTDADTNPHKPPNTHPLVADPADDWPSEAAVEDLAERIPAMLRKHRGEKP